MDVAQIDQAMEALMLELHRFKKASETLTDANTIVNDVTTVARTIVAHSNHIHDDNQRQFETVQNYTNTSEQRLVELTQSLADIANQQSKTLTTFQEAVQKQIDALAVSVSSIHQQQEKTIELGELIQDKVWELRKHSAE